MRGLKPIGAALAPWAVLWTAGLVAAMAAGCDASEGTPDALVLPDVPVKPPACVTDDDCAPAVEAQGLSPECTVATCTAEGVCEMTAGGRDGLACDDGDPCTTGAVCADRRCLSSTPTCDDGDPCTVDVCDSLTGACSVKPGGTGPCDDGNACTDGDACQGDGTCAGTPGETCECTSDEACAGLGDLCAAGYVCGADWSCVPDPSRAVVCNAESDTTCAHAVCDPGSGACVMTPRNEGAPCTPSDTCFTEGACASGLCQGTVARCDDGDPCTADLCLPDGGCEVAPVAGAACDDGDPCTSGDACDALGDCAGQALDCDDKNPCTADACDAEAGGCVHAPQAGDCNDGNPCTVEDTCVVGKCTGSPYPCSDGNPCTTDFCVGASGAAVCQHAPAPNTCDDGNPCTTGDACVAGTCVGGANGCECQSDADCDDPPQADACVLAWSCHLATHTCIPAGVVTCPPNETACTLDACDPATGKCVTQPKPEGTACDDGEPCSLEDHCVGGACVPASESLCDDGDDCTADLCSAGVCSHQPLSGSMTFVDATFDDGLPTGWAASSTNAGFGWKVSAQASASAGGLGLTMTGADGTYDHGAGLATLKSPPMWVYGSQLTLRFKVKTGFAETTAPSNICFPTKDFLAVRVDSGGVTDQVFCLSTHVDEWTEIEVDLSAMTDRQIRVLLVFNANGTQNDGAGVMVDDLRLVGTFACVGDAPCTVGVCQSGACVAEPMVCDDGDPCTADACDPESNACAFSPLAACACDVDADCVADGPCMAATCVDGFCVDTPVAGACDDGDACTTGDTCTAGACVGAAASCDDGLPCTVDSCDPALGCQHTPKLGDCDDGDPCTYNDTCFGTVCQGELLECDLPGPCANGYCSQGACVFQLVHHGQPELGETFDDMPPGPPPLGWSGASSSAAWAWWVEAGSAGSAPNALVAVGPTEGSSPAVTLSIESPELIVPLGGGTLSWTVEAALPTAGCGQDVVRARIGGAVVDTVCGTTDGPVVREVDLGPWADQLVTVTFEVDVAAHAAGAVYVALDDFLVAGGYPCDDEDACTTGDVCQFGACQGVATPGCP